MSRTPIVVGNWKLNLTLHEGLSLASELSDRLATARSVEIGVAPVFVSLQPIAKKLEGTTVLVAGQDCYWQDRGAWTGAVSASLLRDAGARLCIVGHSERRQHFGDTDETVGKKVDAALAAQLSVILCVGETEAERDADQTFDRIKTQLEGGLAQVDGDQLAQVVIAYEPVWAIGTGRTATPDQAQEVHAFIRARLADKYGADRAEATRLQYGGSVKPNNAADLMRQPDIDGALVGGASLKAESFCAIAAAAAESLG